MHGFGIPYLCLLEPGGGGLDLVVAAPQRERRVPAQPAHLATRV
jgi:hypothetical protein